MGSITKYKDGYRAFVFKRGQRATKTFKTKGEAADWLAIEESRIIKGGYGFDQQLNTFGLLVGRYLSDVASNKKGYKFERDRLLALTKDKELNVTTKNLTTPVLSAWKVRRLAQVSPATVLREMKLLSSLFNYAVNELKAMPYNPLVGIKKPKEPPHRDYLITNEDMEKIYEALESEKCTPLLMMVAAAFSFACETGMRMGEICALRPEHVKNGIARIGDAKTGSRDMPLSERALEQLSGLEKVGYWSSFTPSKMESNWRRLKKLAGVDFRFHDSRKLAITRMAQSVNVLDLQRIVGNKTQLHKYYVTPLSEIKKKLDE